MVSPLYKGGYGATQIDAVAPDGESVIWYSAGAFAAAPAGPEATFDYISHRGPSGWSTTPLIVPATVMPNLEDKDISSTLNSVLALGKPGANNGGAFTTGADSEVMLHSTNSPDTTASWELAGNVLRTFPTEEVTELRVEEASPDFCHILIRPASSSRGVFLTEEAAREPNAKQTYVQVYDLNRGCGGEPASLKIVGLNNQHHVLSPSCPTFVGDAEVGSPKFHAVADGGREIFFTTCDPEHHQLFVRLNGSRTLEVSKPLAEACGEVPCPGAPTRAAADFLGASEDGARVFFTTKAPLEPATDMDSGNDLYMAKIGCPVGKPGCDASERTVNSLVQVSHDPNGAEAEVRGVVRLAPDGSRAYFTARGDLLTASQRNVLEGEGHTVPRVGAENLYVYDSVSGQMGFIADLCSGKESSGAVDDARCPGEGTDAALTVSRGVAGTGTEAQTAGLDGRFLVFATYAQLVPEDTDVAKDIYRYDAATGALDRVSGGERGYHANGNDNLFDGSIKTGNWVERGVRFQYNLGTRAVSEDGSRIIFTTAEPLSPAASNGLDNVYEWHQRVSSEEGRVSLISGGSAEEPVTDAVISPDGKDIFFTTTQQLVPQDSDNGLADVYDARLGGGFPSPPAPREPCSSDACQGPLTNPAPLLVPGSVAQSPGDSGPPLVAPKLAAKKTVKCAKGRMLAHGKCVKSKRSRRAKAKRRTRR
jgi:hypothetical protein